MLEFRVNDFIRLKLENGQTNIYLDNKLFRHCKFLLIAIPVEKISSFDDIDSIDEAAERLDKSMEQFPIEIPADVEFWAHCSNLQVWVENNYNTSLLHSNLSFPLLKKLSKLGDPIARKFFKEEIAKRLSSGYLPVVRYLLVEGYLEDFNQLELEVIFRQLENLLNSIEKKTVAFDGSIFEILRSLTRLNCSRAEKIFRKMIISTFNLGVFEQFMQLMSFESLKYLGRENIYWDFISSANKYFFENLYRIANMNLDKYFEENLGLEDFEHEDLQNIIFQAQEILSSLNKMPIYYFIRFIRNLSTFSIEDTANLLDLISKDNFYHEDVKVVLNDNWSKFKNLFVKVKDNFFYVSRKNKTLSLKNLGLSSTSEIDNLERFSFLEVLDLSNNKIKAIPNLNRLSRLRELNLSFNQIESIKDINSLLPISKNFNLNTIINSDNLEPFSTIEVLDLSNNKIKAIPNLNRLSRLRELNLSFNQIESIKDTNSLPCLEDLRFASNKINRLEEFNKFTNLKILDLENNVVTSLESLNKLDKLERLNLSGNKILIVPKFTNLRNIKKLILSKNLISKIDFSYLKTLHNIIYLNLSNNNIRLIKSLKYLKKLKNIEKIQINNNPISLPKKYNKFIQL